MEVQFNATKAETKLIAQIADRYAAAYPESQYQRMDLMMDIEATHSNGCPLDLFKLLNFDGFNFSHDIGGIASYLNRETGKLTQCFLPRCAQKGK